MSTERPKNPWGRGDEYEKELGPEETERIRKEHREDSIDSIRHLKEAQAEFRKILNRCYYMREEFVLDEKGAVKMGSTYVQPVLPENFGFLTELPVISRCIRLSAPPNNISTAENVRFAAQSISERFPDVVFEFKEDRNKNLLVYTAKLQKVRE